MDMEFSYREGDNQASYFRHLFSETLHLGSRGKYAGIDRNPSSGEEEEPVLTSYGNMDIETLRKLPREFKDRVVKMFEVCSIKSGSFLGVEKLMNILCAE